VKVSIEHVLELRKQLSEINKLDFDEIEWTKKGKVLEIPKDVKRGFELIGLSNTDFITSEYYLKKKNE